MKRKAVSVLVSALSAGASVAQPAEPEGEPLVITRATGEIRVDGALDEPAWDDALVQTLDYEWRPGDNVAPPVETEVLKVLHGGSLHERDLLALAGARRLRRDAPWLGAPGPRPRGGRAGLRRRLVGVHLRDEVGKVAPTTPILRASVPT